VPFLHLLGSGRGLVTILLWVVFFMNLFNLYSLANWLPTVVRGAGYDTRTAVLVGTMLQVGGTVSPFLLTWFVLRKGFIPVLTSVFVVAAISIALIGQPGLSLPLLVAIVFVAGACVVGSQPTLNALGATYYPTYLRSTGVGWALGIGRAGSIVGPVIAGQFMAWKWSTQDIFLALSIPAITSAVVVFALQWAMGESTAATPHITATAPAH
jgi:AAHS family 4-hydroxybenzoate transporter-like MFS transporter